MRLGIIVDHHYKKTSDGNVYVPSSFGYSFWTRYMDAFDEITILARGEQVDCVPENMLISSGERIDFAFLPNYRGISEYFMNYPKTRQIMYNTLKQCDCVIVRIPSALSSLSMSIIKKIKIPFALEMVADPEEAYLDRDKRYSYKNIIKDIMVKHCKKACLRANGVSYVTYEYLQNKYPSFAKLYGESQTHFESNYSSVVLPDSYIAAPKKYISTGKFSFVHVSNDICNNIKGHKECIDIIKKLRTDGFDVEMTFIGDGDESVVDDFYHYAGTLEIKPYIHFIGLISNPIKLREILINSDIYLFPSKTEGLPRSVIEAMACGLVCVTSNVGGIPEIIDKENIFDFSDVDGFVNRLKVLLSNVDELSKISSRNVELAKKLTENRLKTKRNVFYNKLKDVVIK